MAAKYRKIDPRIWTDEAFAELSSIEKLVALYTITAQSNRCGLFRFSTAKAAEETGLDSDSYDKAFGNVCHRLAWKYDSRRRVLYLPTWWKYNPPENPKHLKGCLEDLHDLPQSSLLTEFGKNDRYMPEHCRRDFSIAMQIAMANQEQEQEREQEQKGKSAGADLTAAAAGGGAAAKKATVRREPSGDHHALIRHFCEAWRGRYGLSYTFNGPKDGKHVQWILSAVVGDLSAAQRVIDDYISDDDPFVFERRHPIGLLVSNFNKYRVRALATPAANELRSKRHGQPKPTGPSGGANAAFRGARRPLPLVPDPLEKAVS
ncbi:MAG TPA: hypothetical protein VGN72_04975 [Tepidisphaeraceae bacterium]|nr:hypothetical protein [Tepidisphaeraceae bacterium]